MKLVVPASKACWSPALLVVHYGGILGALYPALLEPKPRWLYIITELPVPSTQPCWIPALLDVHNHGISVSSHPALLEPSLRSVSKLLCIHLCIHYAFMHLFQ